MLVFDWLVQTFKIGWNILPARIEGLGNCVKHNSKHNSGNGRNCSRLVHMNKKLKKCSDCSFCSWIVPGTISYAMAMCRHNFVCTQLHRPAPVAYSYVFGVCIVVLRQVNWAWQPFHNFPSSERAEQLEQFYKILIVQQNNFPNLLI